MCLNVARLLLWQIPHLARFCFANDSRRQKNTVCEKKKRRDTFRDVGRLQISHLPKKRFGLPTLALPPKTIIERESVNEKRAEFFIFWSRVTKGKKVYAIIFCAREEREMDAK